MPNESLKQNNNETPRITLGKPKTYYSLAPEQITNKVISKEQREAVGPFGSSIVEDFIIQELPQNTSSDISLMFARENVQGKIKEYLESVKKEAQSVNWDSVFNDQEVSRIKEKLATGMKGFGVDDSVIQSMLNVKVQLTESFGSSGAGSDVVSVSKFQMMRRALDYLAVYPEGIDLEAIIRNLINVYIGHEIGHTIDDYLNIKSNTIPADTDWERGDDNFESRNERFAEFWGRFVASEYDQHKTNVRQKIAEMDVAKCSQLSAAVENYNKSGKGNTLTTGSVLFNIINNLDPKDPEVEQFIRSRMTFYTSIAPENYALPYTEDEIIKNFQASKNS
jgi:hypothetical protein